LLSKKQRKKPLQLDTESINSMFKDEASLGSDSHYSELESKEIIEVALECAQCMNHSPVLALDTPPPRGQPVELERESLELAERRKALLR